MWWDMGGVWFAIGLAVGLASMYLWKRGRRVQPETEHSARTTSPESSSEPPGSPAPDDTSREPESASDRLQRIKVELDGLDDRIQRLADLTALAPFQAGVALLAGSGFAPADVLHYLGSNGYVLPSLAAGAIGQRKDVPLDEALSVAPQLGGFALHLLMDHMQAQEDAAALPLLFRHAQEWWWDFQPLRQRLNAYLQWAESHPPAEARAVFLGESSEETLQKLRDALARFPSPALGALAAQVDEALARRREQRVLGGFGRVMTDPGERRYFGHAESDAQLEQLFERLAGATPKSVLVAGEPGVGKSALLDRLADRLFEAGWLIFEASAAEVLAGQTYIGELEQRVREMLAVLNRRRAIWRVPDFFDLLHKGSHNRDPRGILDLLMPALERKELLLVGEITPRQLAQLMLARPSAKHHFELVSLSPPSPQALDELVAAWARAHGERLGLPVAGEATLLEAPRVAAQYFPEQHEPGRTLRLLSDALAAALLGEPARLPLDGESLLTTVAARSGLPRDVLDDRQSLDLDALRAFFHKRVIGQGEAVECLIDRIAMLKAGLVDNTRPIGVFLFAGPTGTGKTELAKALGELLFGSSDRLLRLDMSEFQSEDSAWRLTADDPQGGVLSLTSRIREQPFSVVLLDEFEKAHPKIWDLFLQVFDDARLTDRSGRTADFRHSIIILTSNVGSTLARGAGPGFIDSGAGAYSRSHVEKALFQTFRREFLNRLDRMVLFNPLDRSLMREILHKELERTLTRRGLRNRDWAVEWEPSAIEFLLDRGFTPDLGARPLRRAIEHHLLAPLARSIVEHRAPEGGQFLFVRSEGNRLDVQFVDPDAPTRAGEVADSAAPGAGGDLRDLVYAPTASRETHQRLGASLAQLEDRITAASWVADRDADFSRMAHAAFWDEPGRFEVLDRIERRDRIQSALESARRLFLRSGKEGGDAGFTGRLAQLLFLLEFAVDAVQEQRPQDALLELRATAADLRRDGADLRLWWQQLLAMYRGWAHRRNMRIEVLRQDPEGCSAWLAVSGFGALDLLSSEAGLHVMEREGEDQSTRRLALQVHVQADVAGRNRHPSSTDAEERRIARRYRVSPSPLVRDAARGWRTGRLDRVLAGEFDVVVDASE